MTRRAGSADLPLHGGHVPRWLADRMTRLGAVACQAIVHHYGRDELLRRLAHPFWFQAFGAVMGMYDETIRVLKSAVRKARLGRDEELGALQRLDVQARKLERCPEGVSPEDLIAHERTLSHSYGGPSVFGWEQPRVPPITGGDGSSGDSCEEQKRNLASRHGRRGAA
jgi:hypothetical protein